MNTRQKRNSAWENGLRNLSYFLRQLAKFGNILHESGFRRIEIMMPDWSDCDCYITTWRIILFDFWLLKGFVEYNPKNIPKNLTKPHNHSQSLFTIILKGGFIDKQWLNIPYDSMIRQPNLEGVSYNRIVKRKAGQWRTMNYKIVHCPTPLPHTTVISFGYGKKQGITDLRK